MDEGRLRNHKILIEIAHRHHATPTQIMLAWVTRTKKVIAIPKTRSITLVEENAISIALAEEDLRDSDKVFAAPTHRRIPLAGR